MRLRDLAGLIVIDFIDMEQSGHVRKVEKAMKEALKNDRARIQVGRISSFGLMEMSRQRLRTGVLEASTRPCPHCEGTGLMRTAASAGLSALRMIEDEATRGRGEKILLRAGRDAAVYVLNRKRAELAEIEARYGVLVEIAIEESFEGAKMTVESSGPRPVAPERPREPTPIEEDLEEIEALGADEEEEEGEEQAEEARDEEERPGRRRRRRRGGRGRRRGHERDEAREGEEPMSEEAPAREELEAEPGETVEAEAEPEEVPKKPRRRRRKAEEAVEVEPDSSPMVERPIAEEPPIAETEAPGEAKPKPRRGRRKKAEAPEAEGAPAEETRPEEAAPEQAPAEAEAKPKRRTRKKAAEPAEASEAPAAPALVPAADNDSNGNEAGEAPRRGWWQRTFG
ncbi:MAG: ribonuclease E/G [Alphaproteobacteria bacterium]